MGLAAWALIGTGVIIALDAVTTLVLNVLQQSVVWQEWTVAAIFITGGVIVARLDAMRAAAPPQRSASAPAAPRAEREIWPSGEPR